MPTDDFSDKQWLMTRFLQVWPDDTWWFKIQRGPEPSSFKISAMKYVERINEQPARHEVTMILSAANSVQRNMAALDFGIQGMIKQLRTSGALDA